MHGTATAGEAGARRALAIYREEIDRVMALLGCTRVSDLTREHLIVPSIEQALAL
ncbi:MAG: alpha-hydroxy-acid oxidizing protein [Burkholderiales bacterium]